MDATKNPPRNGEGDHPKDGGGADRRRHRTVGASERNVRSARRLRRAMSLPEVLLWQQLRTQPDGLRFRRHPHLGLVIDFACLERRLAIEIDGEAHSAGNRSLLDQRRDANLAEDGFTTTRIAARDVLTNLDGVLTHILDVCASRPLHHSALPSGPPPRSGED